MTPSFTGEMSCLFQHQVIAYLAVGLMALTLMHWIVPANKFQELSISSVHRKHKHKRCKSFKLYNSRDSKSIKIINVSIPSEPVPSRTSAFLMVLNSISSGDRSVCLMYWARPVTLPLIWLLFSSEVVTIPSNVQVFVSNAAIFRLCLNKRFK